MAKSKNKKKLLADEVHAKKGNLKTKKVLNPFEVHVNKEKIRILGKKQKIVGLPGVSRTKAIQKRKDTLLREYKLLNKSNEFVDKRIGERNLSMSEEDKSIARFRAIRVKTHNKKVLFNLADDELLTHKGQTLSEIEKFDDPRSDDEESLDENKSGKLDSDFVKDAHFGGGVLTKVGKNGALSHKQLIDQLIEESKKRKAEKQKNKEATVELTEKLDTEWKDLLPLIDKSKNNSHEQVERFQTDDYDKIMRELRFEARGTVSDRLKTEDEIAKEEKKKLEQLEEERQDRMKGVFEENARQPKHKSADDLDDDFVYDSEPEYLLSYNEKGESSVAVTAEINGRDVNGAENEDLRQDSESEGELETDSEDNLSDLKEASSDSEAEPVEFENVNKENKVEVSKHSVTKKHEKVGGVKDKNTLEGMHHHKENTELSNKIMLDLQGRKAIMEQARKELPYTFALPDTYESLQNTFENQSSNHQSVILERMIKCNHPSLHEGNKDSLGVLFAYLLQYINDLFSEASDNISLKNNFSIFHAIVPKIYDLAELNSANAHMSLLEVIKEKHSEYRKRPRQYPGLENLVFLKLVSLLFPTSDFRHRVVTPCFIFIEQMLHKCKVKTRRDISYGLFLSTLFLEFTALSRRYLPVVINFLAGILHMTVPKTGVKILKVLPPFMSVSSSLVLTTKYSSDVVLQMNVTDLIDSEIEDKYRIRVLYTVLKLVQELQDNYKTLPSCTEIFEPLVKYLELIPISNYPKEVEKEFDKLMANLQKTKTERKLYNLVMESMKPKALRLYEPKIEEVFDGRRRKVQSREKAEKDKLIHKLKKETKGALREIRRDRSFLGRVKVNQRIQSDKERNEKVKRIYAEASFQQSELNELDRKKKKK